MVDRINEVIAQAVEDTFEGMLFIEPIDIDPKEAKTSGTMYFAGLDVLEPFAAWIVLEMPEPLLAQMVGELYSLEEDQCTPDVLRDTLAELLNTLAGRVMRLAVPEDTTFSLGLPESGTGEPTLKGSGKIHAFAMGEQSIMVRVYNPEA